jgi:hypothetical protein
MPGQTDKRSPSGRNGGLRLLSRIAHRPHKRLIRTVLIDYGMEHGSCRGDAHEGKDGTFFVVIFRIIEVFCNHKLQLEIYTKHHHTYKGRNQEVNYLNGAVTGESIDNNGGHGSKIKEHDPQKVNFLEFAVILSFLG